MDKLFVLAVSIGQYRICTSAAVIKHSTQQSVGGVYAGLVTVLTVAVSLHKDPSLFIPMTTVGAMVTTELTIALHEHAVE